MHEHRRVDHGLGQREGEAPDSVSQPYQLDRPGPGTCCSGTEPPGELLELAPVANLTIGTDAANHSQRRIGRPCFA